MAETKIPPNFSVRWHESNSAQARKRDHSDPDERVKQESKPGTQLAPVRRLIRLFCTLRWGNSRLSLWK